MTHPDFMHGVILPWLVYTGPIWVIILIGDACDDWNMFRGIFERIGEFFAVIALLIIMGWLWLFDRDAREAMRPPRTNIGGFVRIDPRTGKPTDVFIP